MVKRHLRANCPIMAKNGSFSSLFNLHSKGMNFIFVTFGQNTKPIAFTFWPTMTDFHHKMTKFKVWSCLGKVPRLWPYVLPQMAHVHHRSI